MPTTVGKATEFITFSRGTLATVTDSDGLIKWAPHNLLLASEQFDASNWSKTEATVTANTVAAPNGTSTADTIAENTANDVHALSQSVGTLTAENYTYSVFLKYNNLQYVTISFNQSSVSTAWASAIFDIQNGTLASSNASGGPSIIGTPTISPIGSGWYLCSVTANLGSAVGGQVYLASANTSSGASFRGAQVYTGSSRLFYAWGAHLYRSDLGGMQANASAYPYYNPSTPKNLLGYTELLTTGWTNTDTTDSQVAVAAPNGSANSIEVTATAGNGTLLASLSLLASPYTFSVWLKRKTGTGTVEITVDGTTYVTAAVTSDWQRFSTTLTPSAGTKTPGIRLVTSGDAVYAWGAQLSDSASLDPYSPVFGAAPSAAAYHGPRLDYDGDTLAAKGLLVEEARTNNLLYSNTFDNAYYTSTARATALPNSGTSPDGTNNAYKLQEDNTLSSTHLVGRAVVADTQAAANYCASVFVKKAGRTQARLRLTDNATTEMFIVVNLEDGTVVSSGAGTFTNFDRDVQDYGNGWYRIWIAGTKPNATFQSGWAVYPAVAGSITYDGNGTDGIYIYGGCIENGLFPTSYIPTTTATVTRNADVASVATSQFPYSATEGTIVAAFDVIGVNNLNQRIVSLDESTGNTGVFATKANATLVWQVFTGGAEQATLSTSNSSINATVKTACAFKDNDFAASTNGASPQTDPSGTVGTSTQLSIGMRFAKDNQLNGHIRQITYIPRRLTNAELQSRTA